MDIEFTVPLIETLGSSEDMLQSEETLGLGHRVTNTCARVGEGTNMCTENELAEYRQAAPTVKGKPDALRHLALSLLSSHMKYHRAQGKSVAWRVQRQALLDGDAPIRAAACVRRRKSRKAVQVRRGVRGKFCKAEECDVGTAERHQVRKGFRRLNLRWLNRKAKNKWEQGKRALSFAACRRSAAAEWEAMDPAERIAAENACVSEDESDLELLGDTCRGDDVLDIDVIEIKHNSVQPCGPRP